MGEGQGDRNFDGLTRRFQRNIYGTLKGRIRLAVLERDLLEPLPALLGPGPLRVLDAGGGTGELAGRLAARGHDVTLCDISGEMLAMARRRCAELAPGRPVRFVQAPLQALPAEVGGPFDLILLHAVLEWLAEPRAALTGLLERLRGGGLLSLLFYNRHGLVMKQLLHGQLARVRAGAPGGRGRGLTPSRPLDPDEVLGWLAEAGLERLAHSGVRCFTDYLPPDTRAALDEQELLDTELWLGRQDPYRAIARYQHVLARRP